MAVDVAARRALPGSVRARLALLAGSVVLAALAPSFLPPYWLAVAILATISSIFAIGLNLLMGYTGLDSLGQAAFFGTSAYVAGILTVQHSISWATAAPLGALAAIVLAGAFGLIAVRLRGLYFLLITVAFGQVLWGAANRWGDVTGGANGLTGVPMPFDWLFDPKHFYYLGLGVLAVAMGLSYMIVNSPFGLGLKGIRERELRSTTLGYDVYFHKYAVFVVAAVFAAIAGLLSVAYNGFVGTQSLSLDSSFQVMLMVILGGTGTFAGPIIGAIAISALQYLLSVYLVDYWLLTLGLVYVAVTVWLPDGVVGIADKAARIVRLRLGAGTSETAAAAGEPGVPAAGEAPPGGGVDARQLARTIRVTPSDGAAREGTVLELAGISQSFGDVDVLSDVSLDVHAGERVGIIGLNGAGKTTLFQIVTGVQSPTGGRILMSGRNVTRLSPSKRNRLGLARTFQVTTLYPRLTTLENVTIALLGRRFRRYQFVMWRRVSSIGPLRSRALELLTGVGIAELADVEVRYLSYGHQRQLEIALALASEPSLLLLDEPTAGLAQSETPNILRLLKALPKQLTLLIVEHNLEVIFEVVDRVVVLHQGSVIADDVPEAVREDSRVRQLYFGTRELRVGEQPRPKAEAPEETGAA